MHECHRFVCQSAPPPQTRDAKELNEMSGERFASDTSMPVEKEKKIKINTHRKHTHTHSRTSGEIFARVVQYDERTHTHTCSSVCAAAAPNSW